MKPKIIFLAGPTAVGKTEAAVFLAKRLNAEILSCDSMQVYRGMEIITSQPQLALRKKVRHHLVGIVSPKIDYNVYKYRRMALAKIKEIIKKGGTPLFVGGTGLYVSALIDGIFEFNAKSQRVRKRLYKQAQERGNGYLYHKLKAVDPQAAAKIHPHDSKRIIRALEVFESTGEPISLLQKQRKGLSDDYDIRIFCLNMNRQKLYKRIGERVEEMFSRGLVSQVKGLLEAGLGKTACYAIGIKEIKGYLDGNYDLEQLKERMKQNTRLYAKRQLSWFRKDKRISWIDISAQEKPASIAKKILRQI